TDVIDTPDAVRISNTTPGRCYVRSGTGTPQAVQSARIGGRRPGAAGAADIAVRPVDWTLLGRPLPPAEAEPRTEFGTDPARPVLVEAIGAAAARAHLPRMPSPWLEPLPEELVLSPKQAAGGSVVELPPVVFGVTDLPAGQSRGPLSIDLATSGHVYIAGAA